MELGMVGLGKMGAFRPGPRLLLERLTSRDTDSFSHKLLSALRHQFGGHTIKSGAAPAGGKKPSEKKQSTGATSS